MTKVIIPNCLMAALTVQAFLAQIEPCSDSSNPNGTITAVGFTIGATSGIHFTSEDGYRCANVCGDIMNPKYLFFNWGVASQYEQSGKAKEGASSAIFENHEAHMVAKCIHSWLIDGGVQYDLIKTRLVDPYKARPDDVAQPQ